MRAQRNMHKLVISFIVFSMPLIAAAQSWNFDVSMDGKPIGTHQFILSDKENNQQILKSEAKFNIKILSISFFKYHHQANEHWENSCLKKGAASPPAPANGLAQKTGSAWPEWHWQCR
jgi:hypothetical protein